MGQPKTLLEMAGATPAPVSPEDTAVVLIDCQNEYRDGKLVLPGVEAALAEGGRLLAAMRDRGVPVFHIRHLGKPGGLFDPGTGAFSIADAVAPAGSEKVIDKGLPNAFAETRLDPELKAAGRKHLVVAGFMTHMCVSSTVRAALDLGYRCTVVAGACTTRDLPDGKGGVIAAAALHDAELAALADRFCTVAADAGSL